MTIKEINKLIDDANQVAAMATGNYYLLLVDDIKAIEQWLLL